MKAYSIGREMGCDIVINDSTDVISRRHATLNVYPSGKMTIIDMSQNGTYVNGIKISPNVPVPVTRKDNISFCAYCTARLEQCSEHAGKDLALCCVGSYSPACCLWRSIRHKGNWRRQGA